MNNPFNEIYDRLWEILEQHPQLVDLVKAGNRIKWGGLSPTLDEDPKAKAVRQAGDLPELEIIPIATDPHLWGTSSSHLFVFQYGLRIRTDRLQIDVDRGINAIKWQVLRAFARAGPNPFDKFAYGVTMELQGWQEGPDPEDDPDADRRSARGWNLGLLIECQLAISQAAMAVD